MASVRAVSFAGGALAWVIGAAAALALGCSSSSEGASATTSTDGSGADGGGADGGGGAAGDANPANESNAMCKATVTQGGLTGKAVSATCEYLGIPYGAPPTGPLRFMPPQPAASWSTPRDATAFGPSCLQATSGLGSVGTASEDCLSLNVYTPKEPASEPLPVMVFIYGGAFDSGSSSLYDGQALSEKGPVVLVTLNYRLGALGFLALPDLDSERTGAPSGADGVRDQQLALKWVHDNIDIFHGDPANVTVFGESAGGTSTCIHVVSPASQGLANRFIIESGLCAGGATEITTQAQAYEVGAELSASFCGGGAGTADGGTAEGGASDAGVSEAGAADVLACLRAADPMKLVTWTPPPGAPSEAGNALGNLLGPPFSPTVVPGAGSVLPDTMINLVKTGSFDKNATVLAGSNANEWGLFVALASNPAYGGSSSSPLNITTAAQYTASIEAEYGSGASKVEAEYDAPGTVTDATAAQTDIDMATDYAFRCPARAFARAMLASGAQHYYLYEYNIGPSWHSFELVPLFNLSALTALTATNPSTGYADEMRGYWTKFAATGNPNAAGDGGAPTWPGYDATSDQYLELLDPTPMTITNLRKAQCDFWDSYTP
ncbi:MAG TPA: carboxylesterase family protein, partial [Polyangiaceae bacterium]|nr:carboxylesterase family protein [Polyangiaceae bacterium]